MLTRPLGASLGDLSAASGRSGTVGHDPESAGRIAPAQDRTDRIDLPPR
ncbi:hypothetical protein [Dactylosporangium sp. NPDC048998]